MASEESPSTEIDAIIANAAGWRGPKLAQLRRAVLDADAGIAEEIKWRKPSRPEGVATWTENGNLCMADLLKNAVRLTFPKGAAIADSAKIFNTRLDSATVRAVDFFEDSEIDDGALTELVRAAIAVNRGGGK